MSGPVFLDTNVLVYAALQPDPRSETARALVARRGMISVQVLNEFVNVAHRKLRRPWPEITKALNAMGITTLAQVAKLTPDQIAQIEGALGFKGRVARDQWLKQADALARGGVDEYVRVFGKKPK